MQPSYSLVFGRIQSILKEKPEKVQCICYLRLEQNERKLPALTKKNPRLNRLPRVSPVNFIEILR